MTFRLLFSLSEEKTLSANMQVQHDCCDILTPFFGSDSLIVGALDYAEKQVSSRIQKVDYDFVISQKSYPG